MSSVISAKDLCLWYGSTQALKNINIEIEEKSITALIGPSGCGKSTFLKILSGEIEPNKGEVIITPGERIFSLRLSM